MIFYNKLRDRLLVSYWKNVLAPKLESFRNIHEGEDCFIIGNGPSLNKMDLTLLNDYYTFGLNKIFLIFDRQPLKLSYHVAVNSLVIKQSKEVFKKLNCVSFLAMVPKWQYKIASDTSYSLGDIVGNSLFYKDLTMGVNKGYTVTYVAMQIAYFMGFKRVFLIGVDHNFVQQGNPNEKQVMGSSDPNHFDPNYFKGQEWHLADLEHSEIFYTIAKYMFERDGRQIFDATLDGKLSIYEKIPFEEALKLATKKS
jgi:hypothetical protein